MIKKVEYPAFLDTCLPQNTLKTFKATGKPE